jgi:hypothetical protein
MFDTYADRKPAGMNTDFSVRLKTTGNDLICVKMYGENVENAGCKVSIKGALGSIL